MLFLKEIMSTADRLVAGAAGREKYYAGGLGDLEFLGRLPELIRKTQRDFATAEIAWQSERVDGRALVRDGSFRSPGAADLPPESRTAHVEMYLPAGFDFERDAPETPVVVHFAATGDETFWLRGNLLAKPLLRHGIASVILMNPYYGLRRPSYQNGFTPQFLSDQFKMNAYTIIEGLAILSWLRNANFQHLGVTGVSMGGSMAASVGPRVDGPLAIVPCLAPYGPAPAYLRGVLSAGLDWQALEADVRRCLGDAVDPRAYVSDLLDVPDLRRSRVPLRPDAAILVAGRHDEYVPPDTAEGLHEHWQGSQLRWVDAGHVGAVLLHSGAFREAVVDAFAILKSRSD